MKSVWLMILCLLLLLLSPVVAQTPVDAMIAYGETRSAQWQPDESVQRWLFQGAAREMVRLRATRIAGQFEPHLRLLDTAGDVLAEDTPDELADTADLNFVAGLPEDGLYTVVVSYTGTPEIVAVNPPAYSLTLQQIGQRRARADEDLASLPANPVLPDLETGISEVILEDLPVYGGMTISQPDPSREPNRYLLEDDDIRVTLDDASPGLLTSGVDSLTFVPGGAGIIASNDNISDVVAVFDRDFTLSYNTAGNIYTIDLSDGQTIITDFYRIRSLQTRNGRVFVEMVYTDEAGETLSRRVILEGNLIDLRRRQGQLISEVPINEIRLENEQYIFTDLVRPDTLAYIAGQLRVLRGADERIITDSVYLADLRHQDDITTLTINPPEAESLDLTISWERMGDIRLLEERLTLLPLDGRQIIEPVAGVESVLVEAGAVRITRRDANRPYRLSLPDGTEIETAPIAETDPDALPHEQGFTSRGFNNTGQARLNSCNCIQITDDALPVNPANGNLYYHVTDVDIPSQALPLIFERHYNSQADNLTPAYMLESPAAYLAGTMGTGWRHSYQYDLDIAQSPLGQVTLILPDGAQHRFVATSADPMRFTSRTLLPWVVERVSGETGAWVATRTDGLRLSFDRAGRLQRIIGQNEQAIVLSPMPQEYLTDASGGMLVTEPYGRSLELYTDDSGRVQAVQDVLLRRVSYAYAERDLTGVSYAGLARETVYTYEDGLLVAWEDDHSPHHWQAEIAYDERRRVTRYVEPSEDDDTRQFDYSYDTTINTSTTVSTTVNDESRATGFDYDSRFRLVRRSEPLDGYVYEFAYEDFNDTLTTVRLPTLANYSFSFDVRGNLVRYTDPIYDDGYDFRYETTDDRARLTAIEYPGLAEDRFEYDVNGLASHQRLVTAPEGVRDPVYLTTRYQTDERGRIRLLVRPGLREQSGIGTLYEYDRYGYVATVHQGIPVPTGADLATITADNASRTLRFQHDIIGQLRSVTDGRGNLYSLTYDPLSGRLTRIEGPAGIITRYVYDERGCVTRVMDRGQETVYDCDAFGQVTAITDAAGQTTRFSYDEAGNVLTRQESNGLIRQYRYDALNRLIANGTVDRTASDPAVLLRETRYEFRLDTGSTTLSRREILPTGKILRSTYDVFMRLRSLEVIQGDETQAIYNLSYTPLGLPSTIQERITGYTIEVNYDLVGRMTGAVINSDQVARYTYYPAGYLAAITTPPERVTTYEYDRMGNPVTVTLPDGATLRYEYDADHNLVRREDAAGVESVYMFDALNRPVSIAPVPGETYRYSYDVRGNLSSITDPRALTQTGSEDAFRQAYVYDVLDRLMAFTDATGAETRYSYDEQTGRLSEVLQPAGRSIRLTYNQAGEIISVTERPRQFQTIYDYDPVGRLVGITDSAGSTTSYLYTPLDAITRVIEPLGTNTVYAWRNGTPYVSDFEQSGGRVYDYLSDIAGRVQSITDNSPDASGDVLRQGMTFSYDEAGNLLTSTIRNGQNVLSRYSCEYDIRNLPVSCIDPGGGLWRFNYDERGDLRERIDAVGRITRFSRDDAGRIVQITYYADSDFEVSERYVYDAAGNLTDHVTVSGVRTTCAYDGENRPVECVEAAGTDAARMTLYAYNDAGQLVSMVDPSGVETRYFYLLDDLARVEYHAGDDIIEYRYEYNSQGQPVNVTLPPVDDQTTTINLTYDALNRPVRYVDGLSNVWVYVRDSRGNLTQFSDPRSSLIDYEYDIYDRITDIEYPDGSQVDLTYDGRGNLRQLRLPATEANPAGQVFDYSVDVFGRLTGISQGDTLLREYRYDEQGCLISRVDALAQEIGYTCDLAGRPVTMETPRGVLTYEYDLAGNLIGLGGVANRSYAYDDFRQMVTARVDEREFRYVYSAAGNLLERDAGEMGSVRYEYDAFNRPVRLVYGDASVDMRYDARGRLREMARSNGVTTLYEYDEMGRISQVLHLDADGTGRLDGYSYRYNAAGNLTRVERLTDTWRVLYSYDSMQRPVDERWLNASGEVIFSLNVRYDPAGNRLDVIRNRNRTVYRYNAFNQLVEEIRDDTRQVLDTSVVIPGGVMLSFMVPGLLLVMRNPRRRMLVVMVALTAGTGILVLAQTGSGGPVSRVLYTYDASGNLTDIVYEIPRDGQSAPDDTAESATETPDVLTRSLSLVYDTENRLIRISGQDESGQTVDIQYTRDPLNSQVIGWQSDGGGDLSLIYDPRDGQTPVAMVDAETNQMTRYLHLSPQERLLTILPDGTYQWHLNDGLASTRLLVDDSGEIIPESRMDYSGFGQPLDFSRLVSPAETAQDTVRSVPLYPMPGYRGQLLDPVLQLYINGAQTCDPRLDRCYQPDPVLLPVSGNLYVPQTALDQLTRQPETTVPDNFLEPLRVYDLSERIAAESRVPLPNQTIAAGAVHNPDQSTLSVLQQDEFFRVWQLIDSTTYGTSAIEGRLSPLLSDFYLWTVMPAPDQAAEWLAEPLQANMSRYMPGVGWRGPALPDPSDVPQPYALLDAVEPVLSQARVQPLRFMNGSQSLQPLLPDLPDVLSPRLTYTESELEMILKQTPLMQGLPDDVQRLSAIMQPIVPAMPDPVPALPEPDSSPGVLGAVSQLRQQHRDLLNWLPGS